MKILTIGDIVGESGVKMFKEELPKIKKEQDIDFIIVNAENSAGGMGISTKIFKDLVDMGVDVITMGNHTWAKRDIFSFVDSPKLLRPANYSKGVVGHGYGIYKCNGKKIGVIVIDHLQLLKFAGETKSQDPYMVGNYYVSYFRELAAKYGYAVIVVSQTSRQGFEYATKHNGMYLPTGLAESNELERASTLIITTFLSSGASATSEIQMAILKNRNGERMQETETAPINPEYYMVGTGLAFEPELVPPIFETSSMETMQNNIAEIKSLEEILAEEMNFEGVF